MKTYLFILTIFISPLSLFGEGNNSSKLKTGFVSAGLSLKRSSFTETNKSEIKGNALEIQLGYAKVLPNIILHGHLNIVNGPFTKSLDNQFVTDFSGNGASFTSYFNVESNSFYKLSYTKGLHIGTTYQTLTGKSYGRNLRVPVGEQNGEASSYEIEHTSITIHPGVFYSWHVPTRTFGNSPDKLMTRIEGYILALAVDVPVFSQYSSVTNFNSNSETAAQVSQDKKTGSMAGMGWTLSLTTLFGT